MRVGAATSGSKALADLGGGVRDARPPPGRPNSFDFMQFSGKFGVFTPPLEGSRPPPRENPGSATARGPGARLPLILTFGGPSVQFKSSTTEFQGPNFTIFFKNVPVFIIQNILQFFYTRPFPHISFTNYSSYVYIRMYTYLYNILYIIRIMYMYRSGTVNSKSFVSKVFL